VAPAARLGQIAGVSWQDDLPRAVAALAAGRLVAFPTETVYGLGGDASSEAAVRRVFAAKGRPASHPVIVHLPGPDDLDEWAVGVSDLARSLAAAFWPGPLTLVVRRSPRVVDAVTGGLPTVGLRVPDHPVARALLDAFGGALAAPSANRFGSVSPTTAEHVRADLGAFVDVVLDGGACRVGVESTIVDVSGAEPAVLRPGGVPREAIERVAGRPVPSREPGAVRAPGTLPAHYAPRAAVVLAPPEERVERARELQRQLLKVALILPADAPEPPAGLGCIRVPSDVEGLARELYAALREADVRRFDAVVVSLPAEEGLGVAVADRLRRAAARGAGV